MDSSKSAPSLRWGVLFGVTMFACMLVWSQLVPLGAGPDEPSNFIKSAAIIRGEFIGHDKDRWVLYVDGWAFDSDSGIRKVLVTADGQVVGEGVLSAAREDVATHLSIDTQTLVGYSIRVTFPNNSPRTYAAYAVLNDGTLVILETGGESIIVTTPALTKPVDGEYPKVSPTTQGFVDFSRLAANLNLSYWSTDVDIDPQFGVALNVPWCYAPNSEKPACNRPIEDQSIIDNPPWTGMGRYPPVGFAISGIGTFAGPNDFAFRLARAINAGVSALLIALAFASLKRRSLSVLPLLVALTPGVLFISAVISPSGTEICAAIALWVALPSFISDADIRRTDAVTVALSGFFLIAARPLGVLLYAVVVGIVVIASGSIKSVHTHVRKHMIVYGIHSIAAMFMIWWYVFIFNSVVDPQMTEGLPKISLGAQLLHSIGDIPRVIDESIGNYGWLDTSTPRPLALVVLIMTVTLVVIGWRSLTRSAKRAIGLLGVASVVLIIAEDLNYYEILRGFGVQGRHLTPLLAGIPIIGARYLQISHRSKWVVVAIWCATVVGCGLAALRRYSVGVIGDNALTMFRNPVWSPPLGIAMSIVLLIVTSSFIGIVVMNAEKVKR